MGSSFFCVFKCSIWVIIFQIKEITHIKDAFNSQHLLIFKDWLQLWDDVLTLSPTFYFHPGFTDLRNVLSQDSSSRNHVLPHQPFLQSGSASEAHTLEMRAYPWAEGIGKAILSFTSCSKSQYFSLCQLPHILEVWTYFIKQINNYLFLWSDALLTVGGTEVSKTRFQKTRSSLSYKRDWNASIYPHLLLSRKDQVAQRVHRKGI